LRKSIILKYDPIEVWINTVCASHSNSSRTRYNYLLVFQSFCKFIGKKASQIIKEYEASIDRDFRRKYAEYVKAFMTCQQTKGIAPNTISTRIGIIKSFFKYNDLPLRFTPTINPRMLYHNRDITHEEIKLILNASRPRERAFYAIMAQSGLRPNTICNLKYENIKEDFENNRIPCRIEIPQEIAKGKYHSYFTFIGKEAVKYLKSYLVIRPKIDDEDYLFLSDDKRKKVNPKSISKFFAQTVKKLHEKEMMELKQKKENKPHDIRLYNLRKWFRKYANQAGFEFVQFWMGHTVNAGQDKHYRPKDVEYHRKLYAEKAMPHMRLETATPTETEKAISDLKQENKKLKDMMQKIYQKVFREEIEHEKFRKWEEEHAEEIEQQEKRAEEHDKWLKEHPEGRKESKLSEEDIKRLIESDIRADERRKILKELQDLIKKSKK
jgi:site-specific recombinase XerC